MDNFLDTTDAEEPVEFYAWDYDSPWLNVSAPASPKSRKKKIIPQYEFLRSRARSGNSSNVFVIGDCGSGKSMVSARIGEQCDKKFNVSRICFSIKELLELVNSDTLPPGSVVVLEEGSIQADARRFWSLLNKSLCWLVESFRQNGYIFIINLPGWDGCDRRVKNRAHVLIITKNIDESKQRCSVKWFRYQIDPLTGREFRKYFTDGRDGVFNNVAFPLPSLKLRREYDVKKRAFRAQLQSDLLQDIVTDENQRRNQAPIDMDSIMKQVRDEPTKFQATYNKRTFIDAKRIAAKFSIPYKRAQVIKSAMEANDKHTNSDTTI